MKTLLLLFTLVGLVAKNNQTDLKIAIRGLRNNKGVVKICLYNYENQFPYSPYQYFTAKKSDLKDGTLFYTIKNLSPGTYALSFLDDENLNDEMDYNWLGIPKEGYGFSNDAKPGMLGPPKYEECVFNLSENQDIKINMRYF